MVPLLAAPTCGDPTTVPATDATPPDVGLEIGIDGRSPLLSDLDALGTIDVGIQETFCVYPNMLDPQGSSSLVMEWRFSQSCIDPTQTFGQSQNGIGFVQDSQSGSVGQTVSEGLWESLCLDPTTQAQTCPQGWSLTSLDYTFVVQGSNFGGGLDSAFGTVDIVLPTGGGGGGGGGGGQTCAASEVCCEPLPSGGCNLCAPTFASCP